MTLQKTLTDSMKTTLYMPKEVHRALKREAAWRDTTMSWIINELVMEHLNISPEDLEGERPAETKKERKKKWDDLETLRSFKKD